MLYLLRALFAAVLLFEFANWAGILRFTLTFSWFGLIVTAAVLWAIVEFLWRKLGELHAYRKGWLLFVIVLSLMIDLLGDLFRWYETFPWYDQLAHFLGGVSVAIAVVIVLRAANILPDVSVQPHLSFAMQLLIVMAFVTLFGVIYELEEYAETVWLQNNRLGDVFDTMDDILLNMLGGIAGATLALRNVHQPITRFVKKCVAYCVALVKQK